MNKRYIILSFPFYQYTSAELLHPPEMTLAKRRISLSNKRSMNRKLEVDNKDIKGKIINHGINLLLKCP